jgi:hypothetical protein
MPVDSPAHSVVHIAVGSPACADPSKVDRHVVPKADERGLEAVATVDYDRSGLAIAKRP